jgi:predicted ester cyclase
LEITWQGTHNGPFTGPTGTLPPSGKHQTTPAAMIVKFQGNKAKELHHYFDMMSFLQQIGAMTTPHA